MRRNIQVVFVISALIVLILCSACTLPGSEKPGVDVGLSQITTPEISSYISFEEAMLRFEANNVAGNLHLYYVSSRDLDNSGNASTWIFGVQQSTGTELLMYDRSGWKTLPWNAKLPSEEIILDNVIPTDGLFMQNKGVIINATTHERRDLELKQGVVRRWI